MNFFRLMPVFISFLLLSAHFFRAGQIILVVLPVLLIVLLLFRRKWVPPLTQLALLLGAVEWLYTLVSFAQIRMQMGMPWGRMAIILGVVALFTACSALVFRCKGLKERYSDTHLT